MKKLKSFTLMLAMASGSAFVLTSCTQDLCKDVVCQNGGTCVSGNCNCPAGYEGDSCQTETRAKYVGSYQAADICSSSGSSTYNVTVANGGQITEVSIANFWDAFTNAVVATVSGTTVTIANQDPDNDGFEVQGQGTFSAKRGGVAASIAFNYTITDTNTSQSDVCTSTWTKL